MEFLLNYKYPQRFIQKYKRPPKYWTLEQLHDLWIKIEERYIKKRTPFNELFNKITTTVKPNEDGQIILYCNNGENMYIFTMDWHYGSYAYHKEVNKQTTRGDKLNYLIATDEENAMGEAFDELAGGFFNRMLLKSKVKEIFWEEVYTSLREKWKRTKTTNNTPPAAFIFCIGSKKYIINTIEQYGYIKFDYRGEYLEVSL